MHKLESDLENETHKILLDFMIETDHLIPSRRPNLVVIDPPPQKKRKKKRAYRIVDVAVSADHRVKIIQNKKRYKYWEKKLWNKNVTVMPLIIGVLVTVIKSLVRGLEDLETD